MDVIRSKSFAVLWISRIYPSRDRIPATAGKGAGRAFSPDPRETQPRATGACAGEHGEALPLAGRGGCGSRFSYLAFFAFLFHFSDFALEPDRDHQEELDMPKGIKGSSKLSTKGGTSVKAKAPPAKVKPVAAKAPMKVAPKTAKTPRAKTVAAVAKPQLSVQELQDRIEQLEQANSALTVLVTNALTEARDQIKTLQVELEKSKVALPVSEAASLPENAPSPAPVSAAKTAKKPATKAKTAKEPATKAKLEEKPIIKRGKVKI